MLWTLDGRFVPTGSNFANDGTPVKQGSMFLMDGTRLFVLKDHTIPFYEFTSTLRSRAEVGAKVSYTIKLECTNKVDPGNTLVVSVPMPPGSLISAVSNEGTFNVTTGKWILKLKNQEATLNLILIAGITGSYTQTVTLDGNTATLSRTCEIVASDTDGDIMSRVINLDNYPLTMANMQDGKLYTVISYTKVHEPTVTGIHPGIKNNQLVVENGSSFYGSKATNQNVIQKQFCTFIYDSTNPVNIYLFDQYEALSANAEDRWHGLCLNEGFNLEYSESTNLLSEPDALLDDTSNSEITLEGNTESAEYVLSLPVDSLMGDPKPYYSGIEVQINSFGTVDSNIELWLETSTGKITEMDSNFISNRTGAVVFGDSAEMWGLLDTDLQEKTLFIHLKIVNSSQTLQTFSYGNIKVYLYYQDDKGGKYAIIIDEVSSRNYGIIWSSDDTPGGLTKNISTKAIAKTDGVKIIDDSAGAKKMKLTGTIEDKDFENLVRRVNNIVRWASTKRNSYNVSIPKTLIREYDPSREYDVVLDDAVDITYDYPIAKLGITYIISSGTAKSTTEKITGAVGVNRGEVKVKPIITIQAGGAGSIIITDNENPGQKVEINTFISSGTILIIDCKKRTVIDSLNNEYSQDITPDTVFFTIPSGPYSYNSTGCSIRSVSFYEEF